MSYNCGIDVKQVRTEGLTESDYFWLLSGLETYYNKESAKDICRKEMQGLLQLWRVTGPDVEGLFITQVTKADNGVKELNILTMSGKNLAKALPKIWERFNLIGAVFGCSFITGISMHKTLDKIYAKKIKAKPVGTYFVKEIVHA